MREKPQRIRDPLHNLIEFDTTQFEQVLWQVIQTRPFQRLRRIKQLGFSEFVFPGATHTRFAHSIGTYHTARQLMGKIRQHIESGGKKVKDRQAFVALAATLVHDVGHNMFSHAFEDVAKRLELPIAKHEHVSGQLIRNGEIRDAFHELGSGFANDVADIIERGRPGNLYDAVVSSQFDADRLDYMQRDRLMTGVENSGIDIVWLMNNLEIAEVSFGVDDESSGSIETFVMGHKAFHAAETYILALFQLYPTVYFHKATRGAEKLFAETLARIFELAIIRDVKRTALPDNHPLIRFALEPERIDNLLALDDTVFWGALPMLKEAEDPLINQFANRLYSRNLYKCLDIHQMIQERVGARRGASADEIQDCNKRANQLAVSVKESIVEWREKQKGDVPNLLLDEVARSPYKEFQESKTPLNQINFSRHGEILDMAEASSVVAGLETFSLLRLYYNNEEYSEVARTLDDIIESAIKGKGP